MPLPPLRAVVRAFWGLVGEGLSASQAGVMIGVSEKTGSCWLRDAGGVKPRFVEPARSGPRPRLVLEDRIEIEIGVRINESMQSIGKRLTPPRPASTIKREIDVNGGPPCHNKGKSGYRRKAAFGARRSGKPARVQYRALVAQARCDQRARRPKVGKLAASEKLHDEVQARLLEEHSPAQIAHRLPMDFPDDREMRVSHETIYQSIYVQGKGNLRRELHTCLRTGRALRKPQRHADERRSRIPNMVNISDRPPEALDRALPGHWEGDLIVGAENKSAIGTVVERASRFVLLLHLPADHTALAVQDAIVTKMTQLPAILRKTLTWDQGSEMANHIAIAKAADLKIYFCDPHSPWQRGTNENTNGLLRQYFAKGTDLSIFPADYLDYVATKLNNRPRETLGWKTPTETLNELLSNPSDPPTVASTA